MGNIITTEARFRSRMRSFEDDIRSLKESGGSTRYIAHETMQCFLTKAPVGQREDPKRAQKRPASADTAQDAYLMTHVSFVRTHPFLDERTPCNPSANLPVLISGFPSIVISMEAQHLDLIAAAQTYCGYFRFSQIAAIVLMI